MKPKNILNGSLLILCLILIIPLILYVFPTIIGGNKSYTVLSGSMNPNIKPGDLIITKKVLYNEIKIGDILTLKNNDIIITHRLFNIIYQEDIYKFILKGDANEDPDRKLYTYEELIGKVICIIPFSFIYTKIGFTSIVIIPALIIMLKESSFLYALFRIKTKRDHINMRRKINTPINVSILLIMIIFLIGCTRIMAPLILDGSISFFTDTELAFGRIRAATNFHIFEANGYGCFIIQGCNIEYGEAQLTSDGTHVTLNVDSHTKEWKIINHHKKIGVCDEVEYLLDFFNQKNWYQVIIDEFGDPNTWIIDTYEAESGGETLKVKIFNEKRVFSWSRKELIVNSLFLGRLEEN